MENSDKLRRNKITRLGMAGTALLGHLGGDPVLADGKKGDLLREQQRVEFVTKPQVLDYMKEARLRSMIANAQKKLQTQDVKRAIEGKGSNQLGRILRAIELPITGYDLAKTSWDPTELHRRYPVQIVHHGGTFDRLVPSFDNSKASFAVEGGISGYSNGFYLDRSDRLITNKHVLHEMTGRKKHLETGGLDIGTVQFTAAGYNVRPEQVISDDPAVTDENIDGALVAVVGIDPDQTADPKTGHKTLPGIAKKMTPAMVEQAFGGINPAQGRAEWLEHGKNLFVIILPPGESHGSAIGMSGSPVFKGTALAGIFMGTGFWRDQNRTVDIAFFHGIDSIRTALKNPQTVTIANDRTTDGKREPIDLFSPRRLIDQ